MSHTAIAALLGAATLALMGCQKVPTPAPEPGDITEAQAQEVDKRGEIVRACGESVTVVRFHGRLYLEQRHMLSTTVWVAAPDADPAKLC